MAIPGREPDRENTENLPGAWPGIYRELKLNTPKIPGKWFEITPKFQLILKLKYRCGCSCPFGHFFGGGEGVFGPSFTTLLELALNFLKGGLQVVSFHHFGQELPEVLFPNDALLALGHGLAD